MLKGKKKNVFNKEEELRKQELEGLKLREWLNLIKGENNLRPKWNVEEKNKKKSLPDKMQKERIVMQNFWNKEESKKQQNDKKDQRKIEKREKSSGKKWRKNRNKWKENQLKKRKTLRGNNQLLKSNKKRRKNELQLGEKKKIVWLNKDVRSKINLLQKDVPRMMHSKRNNQRSLLKLNQRREKHQIQLQELSLKGLRRLCKKRLRPKNN